jgi:HEAT repeat protein
MAGKKPKNIDPVETARVYIEKLLKQAQTPYQEYSQREPESTRVWNSEVAARVDAIGHLAKLKDPRAIDALLTAVEDPFSAVREAAIYRLGDRGEPRLAEVLLRRKLAGFHEGVMSRMALCQTADPAHIDEVIKLASDEWVSHWAVEGLKRLLRNHAEALSEAQLRVLATLAPVAHLSGAYDYREMDVATRSEVDATKVKALAAAELKKRGAQS